jgi:hypothetical protein
MARPPVNAVFILWLRQLKRYFRSRARMIGSLGQPTLFLLALKRSADSLSLGSSSGACFTAAWITSAIFGPISSRRCALRCDRPGPPTPLDRHLCQSRIIPVSLITLGPRVVDSPLEEDGFELQVPLFEKLYRVLSKGNAERW